MRLVLRIGGSVVASPSNAELISAYVKLLKKLKRQGHRIAVVVGGGSLARDFIRVAKSLRLAEKAQDEIAISVTRLYAQLFLAKLGATGCGSVPTTLEDALRCLNEGKIVVMGGLKPGMTTDTVAALIAKQMQAELYIKGTDQEGIYNKDPKKHPDAVKLDRLRFSDLCQVLAENKHKAGISQILDPEAVKLLQKRQMKVVVVNGNKTENVLLAVEGKKIGTLIS
ncbi:MAG: UMP kinase [Candidatus Bathyarchaeia archaeon]